MHWIKKTLSETGVQNCDVAVVCIGEQLDISILTTLNLVSLGVPTVISKASSMEHGEILKRSVPRWYTRSATWQCVWHIVWRQSACWILFS